MVALLRGINVGGNRKVPMRELHDLATKAGLSEVATYIQSGNLVFEAEKRSTTAVISLLETALEKHFGFPVEVVVRSATQWKKYAAGSPFPDAERLRPHLLLLGLAKTPFAAGMAAKLTERATQEERIKIVGDAIWVDFAKSVGRSKLTPAFFNRVADGSVTMRNWKTVLKLNEMLFTKNRA
jgi:uncharacterized protein (DUF1697 family)